MKVAEYDEKDPLTIPHTITSYPYPFTVDEKDIRLELIELPHIAFVPLYAVVPPTLYASRVMPFGMNIVLRLLE